MSAVTAAHDGDIQMIDNASVRAHVLFTPLY
jgi:hypothetical protein